MNKQPSPIKVGIRADELLKMRGRSEDFVIRDQKVVGKDENGLIVEWHYQDCTVTLGHDGKMYRVREVKDEG